MEVWLGGKGLAFRVEDTGGFQNWIPIDLGLITLDAGPQRLEVRPKNQGQGSRHGYSPDPADSR